MASEIPLFGYYYDEPILPPSKHKEAMSIEQFQEKYPFRYKLYSGANSETEAIGISPEAIVRRLHMLNNLDKYITVHGGAGKARVLREKQLAVFKDTRDFLETGETEGFVEAPTGFGKTVLFSEVIRATDQRTLIVVPSRILVEQTYHALKRFNPTLDIGRFYSDRKERNKQVIVTTYQSLVLSNGGVNPEDIDLVILDEVHQSLTDVRIGAVGRFAHPVKLGFTATPEYTQDKRVENLLNNEIHTVTLKEAVETGLLCSFSVYLAQTDVDLSNVKIDTDGDYNNVELEEAINIYSRNKSAVELYKKLNQERTGLSKAIAYCVSIKHAQEVARLFNEAGIRAEAIWSDQDPKERDRILKAYKRGEIKVLTNVNVLTEGFDDPQAALCLNLRPTLSKVVAKQRGGRVLRLDPDNPRKHAIIVDYLDRNENKRTFQITFAQVAEGAQIINPIAIDGNGRDRGGNGEDDGDKVLIDKAEPFNLDGLRVITNSQEVLVIIGGLEALRKEYKSVEDVKDTDLPLTMLGLTFFRGDRDRISRIANEIKEELELEHPEYFARRMSGVALIEVVTATGKVAFIKAMETRDIQLRMVFQEQVEKIKETDFAISQDSISKTFRGDHRVLVPLARKKLDELKDKDPEIAAVRSSGTQVVTVCTDAALFKQLMIEAGAILKEQFHEIETSDFVITMSCLHEVFSGDTDRLLKKALEVAKVIKEEYPDSIKSSKSGANIITVCTHRNLFIQKMQAEGIKLRYK